MSVADVNDQNPAFLLNDYFAEIHENLTFVCSQLTISLMPNLSCIVGSIGSISRGRYGGGCVEGAWGTQEPLSQDNMQVINGYLAEQPALAPFKIH